MKNYDNIRKTVFWFLAALSVSIPGGNALAEPDWMDKYSIGWPEKKETQETSWAIAIDNDILVPVSRDQDYTYGINLTLSGDSTEQELASLHAPLDSLNNSLGLGNLFDSGITVSKIEYGLFGFTPEDITRFDPQLTDRPYSSLVYVSSSRESYDSDNQVSWQSTLTLGMLGLDLVGDIQHAVHTALDNLSPRGWNNQISDGGEPTTRYNISRQALRYQSGDGMEVKSTLQASIGYLTEASWSLSMRVGKIQTPWISFNPELTSYGEKSIPNTRVKIAEQYGWAGISLKLRAYNVFLQGQFRDSVVTYDRNELNHLMLEAWLGYTVAFDNGYSFTYTIRGHTSELDTGIGDRSVIWGGILISRTIG